VGDIHDNIEVGMVIRLTSTP